MTTPTTPPAPTPGPADIAKTEAETAKTEAETAKVLAETRIAADKHDREMMKLDVETMKLSSEATKVEAEAAVSRIVADRETAKRKRELADNENHHVCLLSGSVGEASVTKVMQQLAVWRRNEPGCDIEIIINSPGGSVVDGMALWDYIQETRRAGHKVTTKTLGMAASMGGVLLQAGDVRVMGKESYLLIHEAAFGASGKIGDVEDTVEWVRMICERILDIFTSRADGKITKSAIKRKWLRKDWWLNSDEALRLGFVDEIA